MVQEVPKGTSSWGGGDKHTHTDTDTVDIVNTMVLDPQGSTKNGTII